MKYLIDPNYATKLPLNFILRSLRVVTRVEGLKKLNDLTTNRPNKKLFKPYNPQGYDGMEFNFSVASIFTKDWDIKEKRIEKFKNKNLPPLYTFHAGTEVHLAQFRDACTNLADNDKITKKKVKMQVRAAAMLQEATEIGKISMIVFHAGRIQKKTSVPKAVLKNLEAAVKEAEDQKIIIALENTPFPRKGYYIGSDYKDLEYILKKIKSPWLKICFDWGHANVYAREYAKKTKDPKGYLKNFSYQSEIIDALNKEICYLHMHYNKAHHSFYKKDKEQLPLHRIPWDEHLPLTRIEEESMENFKRTIKETMKKTSLPKYGFTHLEILPITYWINGATVKEQTQSIKILKKIIRH